MIFCGDLAKSIATWRAVLSSKDTVAFTPRDFLSRHGGAEKRIIQKAKG